MRALDLFAGAGLIVDNFAGGGGASTGIEAALGRSVSIAINHSPAALAMHAANHPGTQHRCESVWAVDPIEACAGRPVDLAWFSPDCFPAGTMVLTRTGYRAIEEIGAGDEVLTHLGRWRRVTNTMRAHKQLLCVRGHGHPGLLVSREHPFYIRSRTGRDGTWGFSAPSWRSAGELAGSSKSYWASPTEMPQEPVPQVPVYRGRTLAVTESLLWLAGRYIADGWTRIDEERAELVLTCGHAKSNALREKLSTWPREGARCGAEEIAWHERDTATAHQFSTNHRGLVEWLRGHFGHGAGEKRIPSWVLGLPSEGRTAFLDGYLAGDGYTRNGLTECTTVSKALVFGLKTLAATLGFVPSVYVRENNCTVIEGRTVNAKPAWSVRWRQSICPKHRQTRREDGIEWAPVREVVDAGVEAEVFNISVEEDESYVADGIIVHNCTHFSRAKGAAPKCSKRRALASVVIRWARTVRPRVVVLENVEEFLTWGPLDEHGQPDPRKAGRSFRCWLGKLRAQGYQVEWRVLCAADFGAPTTRRRLFLVARCDGEAIRWPTPTHGKGRTPWRTAAEIIDWSIPCPSIFDRKKPLAEATQKRIAEGVRRYVLGTGKPFIVPVTHTTNGNRVHSISDPLRTVTTAKGGEFALVAAFITKHFGGVVGNQAQLPLGTITGRDHHALSTATLAPAPADRREAVQAFLIKYYGGSGRPESQQQSLLEPLHTITGTARFGLVMVSGEPYEIVDIGMRMLAPHELFAAQGFPGDYRLDCDLGGKPLTKTQQIELCGNSVAPPVAEAIVRANCTERQRFSEEEGFDFAETRRAKVPFAELDKIEDMTPFLEPRNNKKERRR